ncbi:MAG: heterodisulfide reductase subunit A-like protein [Deltaproteobacteria bacterium]|nr:heterodisulfide reductase subunit A-like protein [Deltaproteobacteria bacterium]TLN01902.1 MAG: heterodisulfide reductase subunit A-like protein [bacterium]
MGKKGFVLCVCQGTCPSFTKMDIFGMLSDIRREKLFDYVCLHPQLCVGDGDEFIKALLSGGETDKLYVAGCDPRMQSKMFRDAFEAAGFDKEKHVALDIRNKTTEEAVEAVKEMAANSP